MNTQCPHCLAFRAWPAPPRWFELPLALVAIRPYFCRRCARRFLRVRLPDLPLPLFPAERLSRR
jgi:hypothetical protein